MCEKSICRPSDIRDFCLMRKTQQYIYFWPYSVTSYILTCHKKVVIMENKLVHLINTTPHPPKTTTHNYLWHCKQIYGESGSSQITLFVTFFHGQYLIVDNRNLGRPPYLWHYLRLSIVMFGEPGFGKTTLLIDWRAGIWKNYIAYRLMCRWITGIW